MGIIAIIQTVMTIKYDKIGKVNWVSTTGDYLDDKVTLVTETSDGSVIAVENPNSIIKYSNLGEEEWKISTGISINSIEASRDGSFLVGGYFSKNVTLGSYTLNTDVTNLATDAAIIKFDALGNTEWAKAIGGNLSEQIDVVTETEDGLTLVAGHFLSVRIEVDGYTLNNYNSGYYDSMILKITNRLGAPEVQELTVENSRKVFNITTDVNEIDGIKGGNITGEDLNPYEEVKYGDNSTKEIVMTPDEGYEIIGITVNGEEYPYIENTDGTYTMPQFTNVTEDKHVVVTYSKIDNTITINKVDSATKEPLTGVTFKLDQIEERTEPENVIGSLTANGTEYIVVDRANEIRDVLGQLTDNGTYTFIQEDGKYVPTNSATYQTTIGESSGIHNSTANSYIEVDLSDKQGEYAVVVNAEVSSESNYDYGYATITDSTTAPSYSSSTGRFIYVTGEVSSQDYISAILEGGQKYYLHLGYRKDSSGDRNDDRIVFNSIKVYGATSGTYNFVEKYGKYESNNQGKDNTTANSYMEIDLTNLTGLYNLTVNAEVSSQSSDYGYATITSSTTAPSYSSSTGRFIYISGEQEATDYTTVLQGGQKYYLHLGYYKNSSISSGEDKFTVNSVEVTLK